MKRTITLTAEDLLFMNGMGRGRIADLFLDLQMRLDGNEIIPKAGDEEVWKKLDSLTRPVKAPSLGTSEMCQLCADRLNSLLGTKFKPNAQSMKTNVSARLREGYEEKDFLEVIDKKVAEWGNDDKMRQYLRPDTLFSPKFESYLNQPWVIKGKVSIPAEKAREVDYSEGI